MFVKCLLLIIVIFSNVNGKLTSITNNNVEEILSSESGQHKFVKFFAPWCGHCKKMRPDWDKLADQNTNDNIIIADVDCTVEKKLCEKYKIEGFPTLKYFMPNDEDADDYSGNDRSFSGLSEWVEEKLKIFKCSIDDLEACSESQRSFVKELSGMSKSEKDSRLKKNNEKLKLMQQEHDELLKKLQAQFSASSDSLQSTKSLVTMENGMIKKSLGKLSKDEL